MRELILFWRQDSHGGRRARWEPDPAHARFGGVHRTNICWWGGNDFGEMGRTITDISGEPEKVCELISDPLGDLDSIGAGFERFLEEREAAFAARDC
jgi:hypothetical protein